MKILLTFCIEIRVVITVLMTGLQRVTVSIDA